MNARNMAFIDENGVSPRLIDMGLLFSAIGLIVIGLLMVASASMTIAQEQFGEPFYFLVKQSEYLLLGLFLAGIVFRIETKTWEKFSYVLLFLGLLLLVLVLIPGIGRRINGSRRWLNLVVVGGQVSELVKFCMIVYFAGYLQRRSKDIKTGIKGYILPIIILTLVSILLLLEPDFGATVVILSTVLGLMFLAGGRVKYFLGMFLMVATAIGLLAISSPYRMARLTAFLNPWENQFGSGYQLTQSLIAFGQGGWFGVGLGDSVQKLFYLPEAYTDFLFAVIAEELGLVGVMAVIGLFELLITRAFRIGFSACKQGQFFSGYMAYGFALCLAMESMINIGVNCGILPTKGLALPFISYGGSSLLINCLMLAVLLRVDYENRLRLYR